MRESAEDLDTALRLARADDPRGFEALFHAYGRQIAGYLRARGVADADDLANEVFVRAFRNLHTVRGDADRFRSWLFGIAHNAAVDDGRRRRARPAESPIGAEVVATGGNVEAEAVVELERAHILALLDELAPDQRDVLLLRVIGDMSVAQTAAVVGKSYEAVKALQRRGLAALRKKLDAHEGVPK